MEPFVKWAGGKRQLLEKLRELMPKSYNNYFEPFVGGGALFLDIAPEHYVINDFNSELICAYKCFLSEKDYDELIRLLREHETKHSEEYYYKIRAMDREPNFSTLPMTVRAARMIYLNKSCFNGLFRVNAQGYNNVPSAKRKEVHCINEDNFANLKGFFERSHGTILNEDFEETVEGVKKEDFVYFDPPYDVWEGKNSFTSYAKDAFGKDEQRRLANVYAELSNRGAFVMLSNHNTPFINELYAGFKIHVVPARRNINSKGDERGTVEEVIITNY